MLLSSSLEPKGPKSTNHYLMLHWSNQSELVLLPKSYSELEKEVERLYGIETGQFYVETEELNLCKGKRIRIPSNAWDDLAHLLGNLLVVTDRDSESTTSSQPVVVHNADHDEGQINLDDPLIKNEVLCIDVGEIDCDLGSSPSSEFEIQLVEENKNTALCVCFSPQEGRLSLASASNNTDLKLCLEAAFPLETDHHTIIIRKEGTRFLVLLDYQVMGVIQAPAHLPITAVAYLRGVKSPFIGPISAHVYNNIPDLVRACEPHSPVVVALYMNKKALHHEILNCDPEIAVRILSALENIREEIKFFKHSGSGAKWRSYRIPSLKWTSCVWEQHPSSILVVRFSIPNDGSSLKFFLAFGPWTRKSLQMKLVSDNTIQISQQSEDGSWELYPSWEFDYEMRSPGPHNVAFVTHGGSMHIIFDFKKFTSLSQSAMMTRKPNTIFLDFAAEVDVYEFGG